VSTRTQHLYNNFTMGEISPRLYGAVTWDKYPRACVTLENMIIQQQGGVTGRPGTRFVKEVKDSTKKVRLLPFRYADTENYVLECGDQYIRFYKNGARVESGGVPVEVVSPFLEAELFQIHIAQIGKSLAMVHPNHPPQRLSRFSDTDWRLGEIVFDPPPSLEYGTRTTAGVGGTLTPAAVSGANIQMDSSVAVFLDSDVEREILVTSNGSRATIVAVNSPTQVHADILDAFPDLVAVPYGSWHVEGSPFTTITPSAASPLGASITLTLSAEGWRAEDVGKYVLISGGVVKITVFTSALIVSGQIYLELDGVVAQPPMAWSLEEAAWSAANGYPATVGYVESRLAFGGTTEEPDAIWLSTSFSPLDFSLGSTDDAAISIKPGSGSQSAIRWFSARRKFLMGTASDEYVIQAPSDAPLTPKNIKPVPTTPHGSGHIMPIRSEHATLFITANGRILRELTYAYDVDDYRAPDLLAIAEHLTNAATIVDMVYQRPPESTLWGIRSDGVLLSCAYMRDQDIVGWSRHVTSGLFESVCCVPSPSGTTDQVWVVVYRPVGGTFKRYVEYFDPESTLHSTTVRGVRTDSCVLYDDVSAPIGPPVTTVTGLNHLEGMIVQIVGDGSPYPSAVVSGGAVTLSGPVASHVEVGLGFTKTLKPVAPEVPSGGTSMGRPRSWGEVSVLLKDTIGCTINGEVIPFRAGDPMGSPPALFSGFKKVNELGWDKYGYVTVTQAQPLPITVLAITGVLVVGE
jgi:hypothetical protein